LRRHEVEVQVRLDPWDIGRVDFLDDDKWFEAPCVAPGFDDVSIDMWARTVRDLRQTRSAEALKSAAVVYAAMDAIKAGAAASRVRANIATPTPWADAIERLQKEVFFGFQMPACSEEYERSRASESMGLLGRSFETGGAVSSAAAQPPKAAPSPAPDIAARDDEPGDDDYQFED
jgi:hypothetical protein